MNHLKNALWMKKRGFQITIVCTLNSPLHKASKECGLSIIAIRKPSKHYAFLSAFILQRKLRSMGSMHVFVRSSADLSLSASISFFSRKKVKIHYFMEMMFHKKKRQLFRTVRYAQLSTWVCSLEYMRAFVQDATKLNANKLKIIPSGLDFSKVSSITKKEARASLRLSEKNVYFGMIGRIDRKKRIELAIKALKLLDDSTVQLLIIGEETPDTSDTYLNELKKLISTLHLGDQVHFLGFQKDPSPFYRAIDALIMASDFETFGMSTIESLAHNTPVIASNAGGSRELLTKFPFGSLFHAGDHLSLSEAMRQLPNFSERPLNQQGFTNMFDHHNVCKMIETDILSSES